MNNHLKAAGKSLLAIILGLSLLNLVTPVSASGGSGGGGGRYGGTVFVTLYVPSSITFVSSAGGVITAPCVPYQP